MRITNICYWNQLICSVAINITCYSVGTDIVASKLQSNLLSEYFKGHTKTTFYQRYCTYVLSVLVDTVYMSQGLSEVFSLTRSMYQPRYKLSKLHCIWLGLLTVRGGNFSRLRTYVQPLLGMSRSGHT